MKGPPIFFLNRAPLRVNPAQQIYIDTRVYRHRYTSGRDLHTQRHTQRNKDAYIHRHTHRQTERQRQTDRVEQ